MAGIIILLIFTCLLIALLIMPIHVRISPDGEGFNTDKPGFLRLNIDLDADNLVSVSLYVFFVQFTWDPLQKKNRQYVKAKSPRKKKRFDLLTWNRIKFLINVGWQAIKKSKLKKLYMDLDTSNVIINANLYPVFELLNERPRINLNINYSGKFTLALDLQNNLWNFVRSFLWNLLKRTFIFTKK